VLGIKRQYLIETMCEFVGRQGGDLERNVSLLSSALLVGVTLARNYSENKVSFFRNAVTGNILFRARNWQEFYFNSMFRLGLIA
jgi:hypothetical protein